MAEDVWEVLGVDRSADADAIRRAYRALVKRHKPETDPEGFRRLREAYEKALERARFTAQRPPIVEASIGEAFAPAPVSAADEDDDVRSQAATPNPAMPGDAPPNPLSELDAMFAQFDALAPDDVDGRLAVAGEAVCRFPGLDGATALLDEAIGGIEDERRRREALLRARDAGLPGIQRILLYQDASLLSLDEIAAFLHGDDRFAREEAILQLARRGDAKRAIEAVREVASVSDASIPSGDPRHMVALVGLELFANGHAAEGREVAMHLRRLEELARPTRNEWQATYRIYLAELASLGARASDALLSDLALEILGPQPGRARQRSTRIDYAPHERELVRTPSLAALARARTLSVPRRGPTRPAWDWGGFRLAGVAIVAVLHFLRAMVNDCDSSPSPRVHVSRYADAPPVAAAVVDAWPNQVEFDSLGRHMLSMLDRDGGVDALCGPGIAFCFEPMSRYACSEPDHATCVLGAAAIARALDADCPSARATLDTLLRTPLPRGAVDVFHRSVEREVSIRCPSNGITP